MKVHVAPVAVAALPHSGLLGAPGDGTGWRLGLNQADAGYQRRAFAEHEHAGIDYGGVVRALGLAEGKIEAVEVQALVQAWYRQ